MSRIHRSGLARPGVDQQRRPDFNSVTAAESLASNLLAIDACSVAAAEINQFAAAILADTDFGMSPRGFGIE